MIMPTLVRVRNISSSSSNATNGAGMLPFITPTSSIWRASTWPSRPLAGILGQGSGDGGTVAAAALLPAIQSRSGTSPTAPLYEKVPSAPLGYVVVLASAPSVVAGSPGAITPVYTVLKTLGNSVPGRPAAISASPDSGPKENMYV